MNRIPTCILSNCYEELTLDKLKYIHKKNEMDTQKLFEDNNYYLKLETLDN